MLHERLVCRAFFGIADHHWAIENACERKQQNQQGCKLLRLFPIFIQIQGKIGQHDRTEEIKIAERTRQGDIPEWEYIEQQHSYKINVVNDIELPAIEILLHFSTVGNDNDIDKYHEIEGQRCADLQKCLIPCQNFLRSIVLVFDGYG